MTPEGQANLPGLDPPRKARGREALLARWDVLTRTVLPGMAAAEGWPIALDHCFMRVCLDAAIGARWDGVVRRPAVQHLSDAQLAAAVAVAEEVAANPARLPALNAASLRMRGHG
ncbi:hypothetical protein ACE7GA_10900 [Roseomonas sp. CCTCC AB2023176]|uniref:hypothetical protein n=1 Tax=Roseomonas sp. CCTCC AB2023176 TaxID=3342640 RepID=UPI0035E33EE3